MSDFGCVAAGGRGLAFLQGDPYDPVAITSEAELRLALEDRQPFITLVSHIVLGGDAAGPQVCVAGGGGEGESCFPLFLSPQPQASHLRLRSP